MSQKPKEKRVAGGEKRVDPYSQTLQSHRGGHSMYPWDICNETLKRQKPHCREVKDKWLVKGFRKLGFASEATKRHQSDGFLIAEKKSLACRDVSLDASRGKRASRKARDCGYKQDHRGDRGGWELNWRWKRCPGQRLKEREDQWPYLEREDQWPYLKD